jgi:hypothetical protein
MKAQGCARWCAPARLHREERRGYGPGSWEGMEPAAPT